MALNAQEEQEYIEEARRLKDRIIAEQTQLNFAERKQNHQKMLDQAAVKAAPYWHKVVQMANESTTFKGQESYKEYSTSMMTLFGSLMELSKALIYDKTVSRLFTWTWGKMTGSCATLGALDATYETWQSKPKKTPEVKYDVGFDNTGKMSTKATKNGEDLTEEQKIMFDKGLLAWLSQCDCNFDPNTQIVTDSNGLAMTQDEFDGLNNNRSQSLEAFYKGEFDLDLVPAPRATV